MASLTDFINSRANVAPIQQPEHRPAEAVAAGRMPPATTRRPAWIQRKERLGLPVLDLTNAGPVL